MNEDQKHHFKKWEVSIMEVHDGEKVLFKVTRRLAELGVAETRVFNSLSEAKAQFEEWLN